MERFPVRSLDCRANRPEASDGILGDNPGRFAVLPPT
jgi:hypothetical protein